MQTQIAKKYYVYIILTEKDTFYCGYTDDVEKRYKKHCEGTGAKYTKAFKPKKLVYIAEFETKQDATKEEYRIKHLSRKDKEFLVQEYQSAIN